MKISINSYKNLWQYFLIKKKIQTKTELQTQNYESYFGEWMRILQFLFVCLSFV